MIRKLKDIFGGSGKTAATGAVRWIVAGLGNPGQKYEDTRHNAGFLALDHMCKSWGVPVKRLKFQSLCGDGFVAGQRVLFLRPSTFMNRSGEAVRDAMGFYKIPPERVVVLFDDISLPTGGLRVRRKGSDGGHNGIKSILYLTGSDAFPRVKIGVGKKPHPDMELAAWVLSRFTKDERAQVDSILNDVQSAVELIVGGDIDAAMNRYNS